MLPAIVQQVRPAPWADQNRLIGNCDAEAMLIEATPSELIGVDRYAPGVCRVGQRLQPVAQDSKDGHIRFAYLCVREHCCLILFFFLGPINTQTQTLMLLQLTATHLLKTTCQLWSHPFRLVLLRDYHNSYFVVIMNNFRDTCTLCTAIFPLFQFMVRNM